MRWPWQKEQRTEEITPEVDTALLQALLGSTTINKTEALNIPSVKSCIKFIADTVSMLPIKLYKDVGGKAEEVKNDARTDLLNDDTRDTLDAVQFWKALITDYFLGKGGYAYINRHLNNVVSLHYVDETHISTIKNTDPIFKSYRILVNGRDYWPHEFIKVLRNTKDGTQGQSIIEEHNLILSVAYNSLLFEETLVKKGGNKKGFVKSPKKLTQESMDKLKEAWKRLYSNNSENVVILNEGLEFQEASNTSVEMQLNENKETNSAEICKLFNIPENIIRGTATSKEYTNAFKMGVMPVLKTIECALNRELLLENEKSSFYFAFDTKEMLKGDIKERFDAYKTAIDANFMQIDEVRYMEDLPALDLNWIKLGLDSVLYDPKTKTIYTPNTDQTKQIDNLKGGEDDESGNQS
ncbi:phage portal protein, HK97 family [Anaerovirgula multivorans]|uniref:Phage portal protein, HK97 family n=1 Tax=Anaerovirgula multivorans TaxID=312168 RepID=A0A238ZRD0_9FIRM|nr:phage portal protein [Anaerovirgula multivorans]SNR85900.1 phage portal protein, HK97 family [Anaerovirgula multivorans]